MNIFALAGIGIVTTVLVLTLKENRPELAMLIGVCGGVVILIESLPYVTEIIGLVNNIAYVAGVDSGYIQIALKASGIGMAVAVCGSVCADAGQTAIATKLEIAGRIAILILAIPIISGMFSAVVSAIR